MKKILFMILFILHVAVSSGQITLEQCYMMAEENYPLVARYELINLSEDYNLKNVSKAYFPQFGISGKATWQTDVTSIPLTIPGITIPELSKDQYQIVVELSQSIWDGGNSRAIKEAVRAQADVDRAQFEVDMYALRERVNDLYFGILLLDEQLRINSLFTEDLEINFKRIVSYMENGVANQSDLDAVRVEQLGARQNRIELRSAREAYLAMLSYFTGIDLEADTQLIEPDISYPVRKGVPSNRPEMELFQALENQVRAQRININASAMPQLGLFIQGGYGKPGLNMLQDKFKTFAIGGVRLSWNFGSFYTRRNDLRKIDIGVRQVDIQRETFLFNNDLHQTQLAAQYRKYSELMADDDQVIRMRENIIRASEAKFENGTVSMTDLMREVIAGQNAKVNKAVHRIEMMQSIYALKNLINN